MIKFPSLARRRLLWLPTVWGWIAVLLISGVTTILAVRNLYPFLAVNEPVGGRVLVVEGWMSPEALDNAVAAYRTRGYERLITTGAPMEGWSLREGYATYADRAAAYLAEQGIPRSAVVSVPAPRSAQDRTYLSAVMVREWAREARVQLPQIDLLSSGPHARRSRLLYQLAFGPQTKIGVLAASESSYDTQSWWLSSEGARDVLDQAIEFVWAKLFFWPSNDPSRERWG
jgi:hypothetical protein